MHDPNSNTNNIKSVTVDRRLTYNELFSNYKILLYCLSLVYTDFTNFIFTMKK